MKTNIKLLGKQLNSFLFISFLTFTILILSGFQLYAKTTTYTTIKDGNWNSSSTWQDGNIPPSDISHNNTVYIRHTINYNINKDLKNDGLIHIEPIAGTTAKLIIDNGKKVENKNNGEIKIINGALLQYRFHGGGNSGTHNNGDFKSDGDLTVQNGILEVSKNYDSKGDGTKTFIGSCIKVGENYSVDKNNTKEIYEDTYISIGWHGNGDFKLVKGTMEFKEQTVIQLAGTSGDFLLNNGHAYGDIDFITLKNDVTGQTGGGKIKANNPLNTSPSLNLDAYWADTYTPNGKFSGPQTKIDITASYFPTDCTPGGNNSPIAANDTYSTDMNVTLSGNVLTNDSDPDGNTITVKTTPITAPLHGSLTLNSDGTFTYTPTTSYVGTDIFVYEIFDNGTPSLTDQATVTITMNSLNNPPVAVDDAFSENMNQTISGNVLTNDSDPDNDNLTVNTTPVTPPEHGTLS
ncbi:MAG: cadherin-like domain-containing protein, partial [Bacteroidales bacterium]|nr:cadherin-like domain-containing protein [Bacteroidales bacterium]